MWVKIRQGLSGFALKAMHFNRKVILRMESASFTLSAQKATLNIILVNFLQY